ncbi:hypothetical protein DFQ01_12454 [Paenibacillus cellulosilyticus]|uniref:PhzF family phenazine biosynthesis protein n=1 Tax=Paenibacillus cellulosilyticus TaxID=375489 RepID=A0A2V2YP57_9BACL|nr:PhzF family phenazine biosynthesis protein [Paenibacillus cellulosilyticus]PWV95881.1 hypothetical protein DFQ01_12454 [Paenibacillus cellulosilyticus]
MTAINVYHYDAFSTIPNQGNPAGVCMRDISPRRSQVQWRTR